MSSDESLGETPTDVAGRRATWVAVLLVALAFLGIFWLLDVAGLVEPGHTLATIGMVLFSVVAPPIGLFAGRRSAKNRNRDI